jgi:hypothetical protein
MEQSRTIPIIEYIVTCPWCLDQVIIQEENCKIFRHASKKTGEQVYPHLSKEECERLVKDGLVYGCGKPFQLIDKIAVKCDYI